MSYLGPATPSLAMPVSPADLEGGPKFVKVAVAAVENPRRVSVAFTVSFRPVSGADIVLGTFSLYPADNPGQFLVATQDKVRPGGGIVVELNDAASDEMKDVRVGVSGLGLGSR